MIKRSYKCCPISLLEESLKFNDYEYSFAHLMKIPEYKDFYKTQAQYRFQIMDNSVLEGIPLSDIQYIECINEIQPAYYIVPYIVGNKVYTTQIFLSWKQNYFDKIMYSNPMAVCQGQTYEELEEMFKFYVEHNVNLIGIDYSNNSIERVAFINSLIEKDLIPENVKLHLLRCQSLKELDFYTKTAKSHIYSVDIVNMY
jgi:hypothetical protein